MEHMAIIAYAKSIHGANKMNKYYINPCYLNNETQDFIYELIIDYGYKSYFNLSLSDKYKLSTILSKASGESDELNFMSEMDSHYLMNLFRRSVLSQKEMDKDYFMQEMQKFFIEYYDHTMKELFEYYQEYIIEEAA